MPTPTPQTPSSSQRPDDSIQRSHAVMLHGLLAAIALLVYGVLAWSLLDQRSVAPYYVDLADALLSGNVALDAPLNEGYDLIHYDNQWYVAQPPLPALLLMPVVAVVGTDISDVAVMIVLGAIGVGLASVTLRAYVPHLRTWQHSLLVLTYALGTVHAALTVVGGIWFEAQVVAALVIWGFLLALQHRRYTLAGACIGGVLLSRPSVVPALLLLTLLWSILDWRTGRTETATTLLRNWLWVGVGFLPGALLWSGYNVARFGNPLENGYGYLQDSLSIRSRRSAYGLFSWHFLPENLYIAFVKPLGIYVGCALSPQCGVLNTDLRGAGILWTSPLVVAVVAAYPTERLSRWRLWSIALAATLAMLPALLYHNTGAAQFGYRFWLDALPLLFVLLATAMRRVPALIVLALSAWSIAINITGAYWLLRQIY